jgi:hypothetical protein
VPSNKRRTRNGKLAMDLTLVFAALAVAGQSGYCQIPTSSIQDFDQDPNLSRTFAAVLWGNPDDDGGSANRGPRVRLFRMMPGYISDPVGLGELDDDPLIVDPSYQSAGPQRFTFGFGLDNPYFEPRGPGDPGGIGFYRIYTQAQILDLGTTSISLGLQAWTPAGLENGGVSQGATAFSSGIGAYQDIGSGIGLHAFADQTCHNIRQASQFHCGVAIQAPLTNWDRPENQDLFFFIQAVGMTQCYGQRSDRDFNWECLPGIFWKVGDCFSMSFGGSHQGLVTCSWQY